MKQYADIYNENGIAAIFAENFADDFATIFGDNTAAALDAFVLHKWGNRLLSSKITAENAAATVCAVIAVDLPTWQKICTTLNYQYNAAQSLDETTTKTGSVTHENTNTDTRTDSQKAFNDTDFVSDTQNVASYSGLVTDRYNVTETKTAIDGNATQNVSREIDLRRRNNLRFMVLSDIINEICLTIYE